MQHYLLTQKYYRTSFRSCTCMAGELSDLFEAELESEKLTLKVGFTTVVLKISSLAGFGGE